MTDRTSIPVKGGTKDRLDELKRDGLAWDAFVNDLIAAYEGDNDD